jgi:nucleotide-binding universal stress UspA family protein
MFDKILVPLDGSELAERALQPALALARHSNGSIIVLRAITPEPMFVPEIQGSDQYGTIWLGESLERARELQGGLDIQTKTVEGPAAEAIVDTARAESVGLIVMSSHGYSGLRRWVLGSVAERVLHESPCPVMVLHSADRLRHILIPLDGSTLSEQALVPAFEIATALDCRVTLIRVTTPISQSAIDDFDQLETNLGRRLQDELQEDADQYLRAIVARHPHKDLAVETMVMHDSPAESILTYAQTHGVNLIAMSTHGRTGLQRWRYGSVTEKVLRGANDCSMLVIRPTVHHLTGERSLNASNN